MKWINGETWQSKYDRLMIWHKWFAWYPVTVYTIVVGSKTREVKIWLNYIERKAKHIYGFDKEWLYREIGDTCE